MDKNCKTKIKEPKGSLISRKLGKIRTVIGNIKEEKNSKIHEEIDGVNAVLNMIETLKKSYNLKTKVGGNLKTDKLPKIRECQVVLKDIKDQIDSSNYELMDKIQKSSKNINLF